MTLPTARALYSFKQVRIHKIRPLRQIQILVKENMSSLAEAKINYSEREYSNNNNDEKVFLDNNQSSQQKVGLIQHKQVGEAINKNNVQILPKVFTPYQIRGLTLHNRVLLSPLCMYSCKDMDGVFTDFHMVHLGSFALRGTGLVMTEATAVTPNGRLSPFDTGFYNREQMESLRKIVNLVHASSGKIGIQLAHGGRKAGTYPPFDKFEETGGKLGRDYMPREEGGYSDEIVAPSPVAWNQRSPVPNELTIQQIKEMIQSWAYSAKLAVEAGVDVIEIHGAHGYLIHEFLSGNSNKRTDQYGGSLENRLRFALEIIQAVRAEMPKDMPLFMRVSGTDYAESPDPLAADPNGWDIYQVIELCKKGVPLGLDLIDISAGANVSTAKKGLFETVFGFQLPLAEQVKKANIEGLHVASVGYMHDGKYTEEALQNGQTDVVFVGREFLRNPNLIQTMADDLNTHVRWPLQYSWMWPWKST